MIDNMKLDTFQKNELFSGTVLINTSLQLLDIFKVRQNIAFNYFD